jgi:cobalt-zinc-cadmium efflux system protein
MHAHMHADHECSRGITSLTRALLITGVWFGIELVGGIYSNSLALIADAGHMLTDVAALGLSLFAAKVATLPPTHAKTFGYRRAEILVALANGLLLILIGLYILYEAWHRAMAPPEVRSGPMMVIAATGLGANLVTARLLYEDQRDNLNIRGAFLHVLGDTAGSLGAVLAAAMMLAWGLYVADPVLSALVALLVLFSAWGLVRDSVDVLLEGTPRHLKVADILADLGSVSGVVSVHDLHVWSITTAMPALSCHVILDQGIDPSWVLHELTAILKQKHKIEHTTIQIEIRRWVMPSPDR